nr:hypothetical protein [Tanacetum cinerariifolium]
MGDEHLDTIPATESDQFLKSGVENLIPIPSESEGIPKHVCDVPFHDNSPPLDILKDQIEDFSNDDQSCYDEDVLDKIVLKPLCEEEIIPMKIDQHPDNAESDLMKSLRTHDSSLLISSKIDSLLDEFAGELTLLKSIPPGIDETDCDFKEDIRLIEKLLDILILKDLPSNNSLSFAEKELFHFDIPLFSRPPAKPPDGDTGILNIKMMGDISDQNAFMHKLMIPLAPHQEKSPNLISHQCETVKKFNTH